MRQEHIDRGRDFDWGLTSHDYAKYRDIYPAAFYEHILALGLCQRGQAVLDLGTGTGVLPRNLYAQGAVFTGIDSSENQISQARALAEEDGMEMDFQCVAAEAYDCPDDSFDTVTACQCFAYFQHPVLAPRVARALKTGGKLAVLYMAWLPFEDAVAGKSEALILKYNPDWTGGGERRRAISIPEAYAPFFMLESEETFTLPVAFTRESWHGRIKTCRGVEASLGGDELAAFDTEHRQMLEKEAPPEFSVLHYAAMTVLTKKA